MAQAKEAFAGKSVMILQSGGGAHYIQTAGATLGSMAEMIGLENVYENETSSMVQLDYEQALDYDPDLVLCVGATGAEEHKEMMEADFAANEAVLVQHSGYCHREMSSIFRQAMSRQPHQYCRYDQ